MSLNQYYKHTVRIIYKDDGTMISGYCKMFDIPKAYWLAIMRELIEDGYVGGLRFVGAKDMEQVLQVGNIKITKKGRDFLKDESVLSKIKPVLGTGFEALVTAVASTIMP